MRSAFAALFLVLHAPLAAQSLSSALSGVVADPQGAVVQGAVIVARHTATGAERQVSTDERGLYRVAGLPPGDYTVQAAAEGFKASVYESVLLSVGQEAIVDFRLELGALAEAVSVVAEQTTVSARGGSLEQLVSEQQLENLPLNGRDLTQLILLQKGVVQSRGSTRDINVGFGTKVSVGGARPSQNLFVIDGADANDALNNTPAGATGQMTGVETIAEFRVSTHPMNAKFGRAAGGVFNMVTKSGGNNLHGSAFFFHRNDNLDARNFFDAELPEFRRNQFGGSLGGPLVRDRTFFFGSYEAFRENKGVTQVALVPDLAIRSARPGDRIDFAASGDSAIVSPHAGRLLDLYPLPTGPEVVSGAHIAEFRGVLERFANEDFFSARVDHKISNAGSLFARYLSVDSEYLVPVLLPDFPNLNTNRRHILTGGETHTLSPSAVIESRFSFNRSTPAEQVPTPPGELNVPLIEGRDLGSVLITAGDGLPGLTETGTDRTNPKSFFNDTWQLSANLSLQRGRHAFEMGALFERFTFDASSESRSRGRLEFRSLRRLLEDEPRRIEGASAQSDFERLFRQSLLGLYAQDDVRLSRSLTLFAGLRWEFVTTPVEENGKISNITDFRSPDGEVILGDARFAAGSSVLCCRELFDNPTRGNLSPRLGLAWDVGGAHRTIVRAGFGLFYEQPLFSTYRSPMFRSLPFVERSRIDAEDWPGGPSIASLPLDPVIFASPGAGQETEAFQYDVQRSYLIRHNLEIEQDIGRNSVVSLGYAGSRGVNLFGNADTNLAIPEILPGGRQFFPDNTRRNPGFDAIQAVYQGFNSWYHSLQAGLLKRQSDGLSWQLSYTYSRCIDERSATSGRQEQRFGQARAFDPYNRASDKGLCDFHLAHALVLTHVYDIPTPQSWRGPAAALRSWRFNGILNLTSGLPFTVYVEGDPDNDGADANAARPDAAGDPYAGFCPNGAPTGTPDCWFNPAAFAFPGAGFRGNLGRNTLLGPGLATYDASLTRSIRWNERVELQFRVEAFNLFNKTNLNPPANSDDGARIFSEDGVLDPTGSRISERSGTSTSSRQIQLGLRVTF